MAYDIPPAWQPALSQISSGTCIALGDVDSGKSTFCAILASAQARAGRRVAVVDADVGQSDIGPPAAVSMGIVPGPIERLEEVPASAIDFVGATSPAGHLLQAATSTAIITRKAGAQADLVIVDTTGMIRGGPARALKAAKIALLSPDWLVVLQREEEAEPILAPYRFSKRPQTVRLPVSKDVQRKTFDERRLKRQRKFAEYFGGASTMRLPWSSVALEGSALFSGTPMPGQWRAHAEEYIGADVHHVERTGRTMLALANGPANRSAERAADSAGFEVEWLSRFENLLVGLLDPLSDTIALGIILGASPQERVFKIISPLASAENIACIRLGSMRLLSDGTELGEV